MVDYTERNDIIKKLKKKLTNAKDFTYDMNRISFRFLDTLYVHFISKGSGDSLMDENVFFYDEDFKSLKMFIENKKTEWFWMDKILKLVSERLSNNSYSLLPNRKWKKAFVKKYPKSKFFPEREFFLLNNKIEWRYVKGKKINNVNVLINDSSAWMFSSTKNKNNRFVTYTVDEYTGYKTKEGNFIIDKDKIVLKQKGNKHYYVLRKGIKIEDCEVFVPKNIGNKIYKMRVIKNKIYFQDKKGLILNCHPDLLCYLI